MTAKILVFQIYYMLLQTENICSIIHSHLASFFVLQFHIKDIQLQDIRRIFRFVEYKENLLKTKPFNEVHEHLNEKQQH